LLQVGERLFNLKRLINVRLGVDRADDVLPPRFLEDPRPSGTAAGNLPELEMLLPLYYEQRGWTSDGKPTQARLEALGL
ncbi:MAG: aldehyde ferredoxin oxidoreductase C-terminal domain-containing protein, partial [Anaerolineae bacterium]